MKRLPARRPNRLDGFDYASAGCYFITFCTRERRCVLGTVERPMPMEHASVCLSDWGTLTECAILAIPEVYPSAVLENYVIMPNHVHLLISLTVGADAQSVSRIIQQTKRRVSRAAGQPIWQSHFHDHIVRDEQDFQSIWQYIENNPTKWSVDRYYSDL